MMSAEWTVCATNTRIVGSAVVTATPFTVAPIESSVPAVVPVYIAV
jgi:hypothetical protein